MNSFRQKQKGAVLLISLMLLVVVTLMTFAASNSTLLQERMTSGNRDNVLALQVAETALSDAEAQILTYVAANYTINGNQGLFDGNCDVTNASCYLKDVGTTDFFDPAQWTAANSRQATTGIQCPNNACAVGRYKVIRLGPVTLSVAGSRSVTTFGSTQVTGANTAVDYILYRIIATGTGIDPNNRRVIVSHYAAAEQ